MGLSSTIEASVEQFAHACFDDIGELARDDDYGLLGTAGHITHAGEFGFMQCLTEGHGDDKVMDCLYVGPGRPSRQTPKIQVRQEDNRPMEPFRFRGIAMHVSRRGEGLVCPLSQ